MKIPLSDRLLACCNFVTRGDRVADIGCDHGYLGIYLLTKGIAGSVCLDLQAQFHWEYELMPLQDAPEEFGELPADGTAAGFRCATFTVEGEPGDTFIEYPGIKGQVWVNGFNLGRYWDRGPSETLYVPAPVLKSGENRVVVMEWEKFTSDKVTFTSEPRLGIPEQG
jgi:beta-galactosidase